MIVTYYIKLFLTGPTDNGILMSLPLRLSLLCIDNYIMYWCYKEEIKLSSNCNPEFGLVSHEKEIVKVSKGLHSQKEKYNDEYNHCGKFCMYITVNMQSKHFLFSFSDIGY